LSLSQNQLAKLLEFEKGSARISEYEHGNREPDLVTLLIYANLARVSMDVLVNDDLELKFRKDWKAPS
jgi:transcriptional regulator with XRE-family HTH domain